VDKLFHLFSKFASIEITYKHVRNMNGLFSVLKTLLSPSLADLYSPASVFMP